MLPEPHAQLFRRLRQRGEIDMAGHARAHRPMAARRWGGARSIFGYFFIARIIEELAVGRVDRLVEIWCGRIWRSEEHTSELQSLMRISYAVFCLTKKIDDTTNYPIHDT